MKRLMRLLAAAFILGAAALAQAAGLDGFTPLTGAWRADSLDGKQVLIADGAGQKPGGKERFPAARRDLAGGFAGGEISVRFKPLAGKIDQAAGILFDLKDNGDYLVVRANALENNLNIYQYKNGRRTPLKEVPGAATASGVWHELKITVAGTKLTGSLDGKPTLEYTLPAPVSGGVGLWTKDDSVTAFEGFTVKPGK